MIITSSRFVKSVVSYSTLPDDHQEIAVVGRSNVGKSSFLNYLCNRNKLVATSRTPGKTREINFFLINESFYLVDIPGFGYAKTDKKTKAEIVRRIEEYFTHSKKLAGVIYLLDIRRNFSEVDMESIKWLGQFKFPILILATKTDKLNKKQVSECLVTLTGEYGLPVSPLPVSSLKKTGKEEVLSQLGLILAQRSKK